MKQITNECHNCGGIFEGNTCKFCGTKYDVSCETKAEIYKSMFDCSINAKDVEGLTDCSCNTNKCVQNAKLIYNSQPYLKPIFSVNENIEYDYAGITFNEYGDVLAMPQSIASSFKGKNNKLDIIEEELDSTEVKIDRIMAICKIEFSKIVKLLMVGTMLLLSITNLITNMIL